MSPLPWPDPREALRRRRLLRQAHRLELPLREGNALRLLESGADILAATRALIQGARGALAFEIYIWADDAVGRDLALLLREAHRRGVRIRGVVDGVGSWAARGLVQELKAEGLDLRIFHPPSLFNSLRVWNRRNHRKLLLRDGEEAVVGSANWGLDYATDWNPLGFHDLGLQVRGPVVGDLQEDFERAWARAGGVGEPVAVPAPPSIPEGWLRGVPVQVVSSLRWRGPAAFARHARLMLAEARTEVLLLHAYFIPTRGVLRGLVRAARRGVAVTVLVPGHTDQPFVQAASRYVYGELMRAGVRIWERPTRMLHAKVAVVDGAWVSLGSANLDARSARFNLELNLHVHSPKLAQHVQALAQELRHVSAPCDPDQWRQRPWWRRWGQRWAWTFRAWL